jgi:hypothetical protein
MGNHEILPSSASASKENSITAFKAEEQSLE